MSLITITSFTVQPTTSITGNSCVLRLWYNYSFLDSSGQYVQGGTATTGNQIRVDCTIASGVITVPSFSLYSTLDSQVPYPQSINISASFFKGNSNTGTTPFNQIGTPPQWIVPNDLGGSISFAEWTIANQRIVLANPPQTFYTAAEVDALIAAAEAAAALNQDVVIGEYSSFANALSTIGSTPTTLVINQATTCSTNATVPSTLTLRFTRRGSLTVSTGITCTVLGSIEADPIKIFYNCLAGQGTVAVSSYNLTLYPQWWGALCDGIADDTEPVNAALETFSEPPPPEAGDYVFITAINGNTITDSTADLIVNGLVGTTLYVKYQSNDFVANCGSVVANTTTTITATNVPGDLTPNSTKYAVGASVSKTRRIQFPGGITRGNFVLTEARGAVMSGSARYRTHLRGIGTSPALAINGMWYSEIENITFDTENGMVDKGVVELDGNYDSTHTLGVQSVIWRDCDFFGRGTNDGLRSTYAFTLLRQGGSSGQGDGVSWYNSHWSGASFACFYSSGFNALNNTIFASDMQDYSKHGAYFLAGAAGFYYTSFESTTGYTQILNGGYDIDASASGDFSGMQIYGCRTESLRFFNGTLATPADIRGFNQRVAVPSAWIADHDYEVDDVVALAASTNIYGSFNSNHLYAVTTAGTSGSSEPTWPASGTVADGGAVWTEIPVAVINGAAEYDVRTGGGPYFINSVKAPYSTNSQAREISESVTLTQQDGLVLVNAASNDIVLTMPGTGLTNEGQVITIRRVDVAGSTPASLHTVTINSSFNQGTLNESTALMPGNFAVFALSGGGGVTKGWYQVGGIITDLGTWNNTATAGASTLNASSGLITSEALTTAADSDYVLTLTNNRVTALSIVYPVVQSGTNTTVGTSVQSVTPGAGSVVIRIRNTHATDAWNGTIKIRFMVW